MHHTPADVTGCTVREMVGRAAPTFQDFSRLVCSFNYQVVGFGFFKLNDSAFTYHLDVKLPRKDPGSLTPAFTGQNPTQESGPLTSQRWLTRPRNRCPGHPLRGQCPLILRICVGPKPTSSHSSAAGPQGRAPMTASKHRAPRKDAGPGRKCQATSAGAASVGRRDAPSVTDGGGMRRMVQERLPDSERTQVQGCEVGAGGAENPGQTQLSLCPVCRAKPLQELSRPRGIHVSCRLQT